MNTYVKIKYILITVILLPIITVTQSACVPRFDPDAMQPHAQVNTSPVYEMYTVGQTFVSQRPRLCAIAAAWAVPGDVTTVPKGPLVLSLYPNPQSSQVLARIEVQPQTQQNQAMVRWSFPPLPDSEGQSFYFEISAPQAKGDYPLRLYMISHDTYKPGQAYANKLPHAGDLTFHTFYDYSAALWLQDIFEGLSHLWLILPFIALFIAPGYLLLQLWPSAQRDLDIWSDIGMAFGLSLAISPWVLLWITQFGGTLSPLATHLLYWGCGITMLIHLTIKVNQRPPGTLQDLAQSIRATSAGNLLLVLILSIGLIVRFLAIRDLTFPAWVDSVHHGLLTRLIYESGQVPATYAPYIPSVPATYHYGFQAHVALFMRLSGLSLTQAMLWIGQCFNACMALQVYLLARWLTQRPRTALFAALCVAILGTMPAFYVTWGRYTQLTGLLILPVALILSVETVKPLALQMPPPWRRVILTILTLAGLITTHYRVFAFYVSLIGAWWLVHTLRDLKPCPERSRGKWPLHLLTMLSYAGMSMVAILLLMPWILGIARQLWLPAVTAWSPQDARVHWDFSWRYVTGGLDRYLLTLGTLGLLVGLINRESFAGVLSVWIIALFVITNPGRFGLPGEGLINNVAMLITWFIPMAIGSGFLLDMLITYWRAALSPRLWPWGLGFLSVGLIILSSIGIRQQIAIVEPQNLLALQADYEALTWIQIHTPTESHFYINVQPWQSQIYVGSDGGYWITSLAQRTTVTPPALYPLTPFDNHALKITTWAQRGEAAASDPERLAEVLREAGADYVYIGALGGFLDPDSLHTAPMFELQYENERVTIFAIRAATQ